MKPTETKNLTWKDAWWYLLNGKKIKRALWEGYWAWENNTIMMHCRDGSVTDIRETDFVAYTFSNIAQRDWMVVMEGEPNRGERREGGQDMINAGTILEVTRNLIGATEPYGDSGIDRERTENVDKLIYIINGLLYDLEKVAVNKDRHEGSMREMGKKAHKAMQDLWSWINAYLADDGGGA